MNNKEVDASRLNTHDEPRAGFSTIEASAVKKIVRESWESKLKERGTTLDILNEHAEFMTREFSALDYETLCMQNIAARAKHMSKGELLAYTNAIEALAIGYKERFGADLGSLLIAGITLVAKDFKTVSKHLDYFLAHVSESAKAYETAIGREVKRVERLDSRLRSKNSGILRFFRKKEIAELNARIRSRQARISRLSAKKARYAKLGDDTRSRADPRKR